MISKWHITHFDVAASLNTDLMSKFAMKNS